MTLTRQKKSLGNTPKMNYKLKKEAKVTELDSAKRLTDEKFIGEAIFDCLKNNDPEGVMEIIEIYLNAINKVKAAETNKLSRATMYKAFKRRNPTIKTLAKLVNCCALSK